MYKKRLTAALLALMMTASLCACGDDPVAEKNVSDSDLTEVSVESDAASEATETEKAESESDETENNEAAPADNQELAEVQRVAEKYFKAAEEKDYETLADVFNVEFYYYMNNGEMGDRDKYIEYLKTMSDEDLGVSGADADTTISDPVCANDHAEEYNNFFRTVDEQGNGESALAENFKVDGVYTMRMKSSGSTESATQTEVSGISMDISVDGNYNLDVDIPILHINGEWKVDPGIDMMIGIYQMFAGMAESMGASSAAE